jgi:hypothetical protein
VEACRRRRERTGGGGAARRVGGVGWSSEADLLGGGEVGSGRLRELGSTFGGGGFRLTG